MFLQVDRFSNRKMEVYRMNSDGAIGYGKIECARKVTCLYSAALSATRTSDIVKCFYKLITSRITKRK